MSVMVITGLIASVALLFAFAMLNLGKWGPNSYPYQILNFIGAGFLAWSALDPFNAGVFWTEVLWSLLGLFGIIKIYVNRRKAQQQREVLPTVPSSTTTENRS